MNNFGAKMYEESEKPKVIGLNQPSGLLRKTQKMNDSSKVGYGKSANQGLGVYAKKDIRDGEVIEVAPIIFTDGDVMAVDGLNDYAFTINKEEDQYAIALGYGSLYNHSDSPNAEWNIDSEKKELRIIASEAIVPGQEIFISYGQSYWDSRK